MTERFWVETIACLKDNYAYLVTCTESGESALVDAPEAAPVLDAIAKRGARVTAIWSTHHHFDHVGANEEVAAKTGARAIYGHASDRGRIPGQTHFLEEGQSFTLGKLAVRALHIPGHTTGAVAYVVAPALGASDEAGAVFTGDTLFLAGCGRLFEGTAAMMFASLAKLAALPRNTRVYCGHEYTTSNLKFAAYCEPSNQDVARRAAWAAAERAAGRPTVPGTLSDELTTNPFLRVREPELRRTLSIPPDADDAVSLGIVRKAKDNF